MSDGPKGRGISVTIKYPKPKYQDAPWGVFHGNPSEVREDIIAAFGFDGESVADLTLHEVVLKAQEAVQGAGNVANSLGGKVLSQGGEKAAGGPSSGAWSQAGSQKSSEPEQPEDPTAWLKVEIDKATTKDGLKRLWADNQAAFNEHPELLELWKAKGKSL